MSGFRKIDISDFEKIAAAMNPGERPKFAWIEIDKLVIDDGYQREMTKHSRKTVERIASAFNWACFEPPIVASIGGGRFAIINGQHRTTGAALCGLNKGGCRKAAYLQNPYRIGEFVNHISDQDELTVLETAREIFRRKLANGPQGGCTSYLQRQMQVGYNYADSIVGCLERERFISEPNRAGERHLLKKK